MSSAETKTDSDTVLHTSIRAGVLDTTLDVLKTAADEAILRVGKEGLDVALTDPGNVMVHFVDIDAAAFEQVPGGQFALGMNLERLQDAIDKAEDHSTVTLALNTETRRLNVTYGNVDVDLAMIDPDSIRDEPDLPDVELPNRWSMTPEQFADGVDVVDLVTDHIRMSVDAGDGTLTLRGEGDIDTATVTFGPGDFVDHEFHETAESLYSMDYIKEITKGMKGAGVASDGVQFRAGNELPLRVFWDYADGHAEVQALLAPRIESE